jgi:hypothetical protein
VLANYKGTVMKRLFYILIGFTVGWLVYVVEYLLCATAYGGPFTVFTSLLMLPLIAGILSGMFVAVAWLVGLLLTLPKVRDVWRFTGYWSILLTVAATGVMVFAAKLGLRTVDPITGYKIMSRLSWCVCFFSIVFPIVNLPVKEAQQRTSPESVH